MAYSASPIFLPDIPIYHQTYRMATLAVQDDLAVMILGETGVGKGTLVSYIHQTIMCDKPLVMVDCGAICNSLAEAELFGSEAGAFTGSTETKIGKLELANGGILFLDEIGNLSLEIQNKVLCALESKRIMRIGGSEELQLDFKLVTATNKDLDQAVQEGVFRSDLYYRVKQFSVRLPALREDSRCVTAFLSHYVSIYNAKYHTDFILTESLRMSMVSNAWLGNLRELKNAVQTMVWLHSQKGTFFSETGFEGDSCGMCEVGHGYRRARSLNDEVNELEIEKIKRVLLSCSSISEAARSLGIHRSTLQGKLRKYGLYPTKPRMTMGV